MTLLNRDVLGRRVQILAHVRILSRDHTVREWWDGAVRRRGRGYWPQSGPWPIFRYWMLGPLVVRVWTARAMWEERADGAR